jgi:cytochrome c2
MTPKGFAAWLVTVSVLLGPVCRPVPGLAAQQIPLVSGNPARGRDVYVGKGCIACHAVRESGGRVGPDLAAALVGKGIVGIAAAMLNHYPKMSAALQERNQPLPLLSPGEMDDLIAYLLFINFLHEPGSMEHGRAVFNRKGCARCHGLFPGGTSIGPPLGRAMLAA